MAYFLTFPLIDKLHECCAGIFGLISEVQLKRKPLQALLGVKLAERFPGLALRDAADALIPHRSLSLPDSHRFNIVTNQAITNA